MAAFFVATAPISFDTTGITSYDTKAIDPNGPTTGFVVFARGINTAPAGTLTMPSLSHVVTQQDANALRSNLGLTNGQRNTAIGMRFSSVLLELVGATRFPHDHGRRWIRLGGINLFRLRDDGTVFECALPFDRTLAEYLAVTGRG